MKFKFLSIFLLIPLLCSCSQNDIKYKTKDEWLKETKEEPATFIKPDYLRICQTLSSKYCDYYLDSKTTSYFYDLYLKDVKVTNNKNYETLESLDYMIMGSSHNGLTMFIFLYENSISFKSEYYNYNLNPTFYSVKEYYKCEEIIEFFKNYGVKE